MKRTSFALSILLVLFAGSCSEPEPEPDPQDVWLYCDSEKWDSTNTAKLNLWYGGWRGPLGPEYWILKFNIRTKKYETASWLYHIKHSGKLTVEDTVVGMELEDGTLVIVNRETLTAAIKPPFSINKSEESFLYSCELYDEEIGKRTMQSFLKGGAEMEAEREQKIKEKNKF